MNKFEKHILDNYKDDLNDIAKHGCASAAVSGLVYYHDTVKLYDQFSEELHEMLAEYMDDVGGDLPKSFYEDLKTDHTFKNWMVWFVAETIANRFVDSDAYEEYKTEEDETEE